VATARPSNGWFHCFPTWLRHAGEQNLSQAVHEGEERLLGSPQPEHLPSDLLDARGQPVLGTVNSSLCSDNSCSTEWRMNAVGDEKPRLRAAS
jgi:hypothetical protein